MEKMGKNVSFDFTRNFQVVKLPQLFDWILDYSNSCSKFSICYVFGPMQLD